MSSPLTRQRYPWGGGGPLELALAGFGIGFVGSRSLDLCREESHGGLAGRYFWNDAPAVGLVGWGVFMVGFFVFLPCNLVVVAGKVRKEKSMEVMFSNGQRCFAKTKRHDKLGVFVSGCVSRLGDHTPCKNGLFGDSDSCAVEDSADKDELIRLLKDGAFHIRKSKTIEKK